MKMNKKNNISKKLLIAFITTFVTVGIIYFLLTGTKPKSFIDITLVCFFGALGSTIAIYYSLKKRIN